MPLSGSLRKERVRAALVMAEDSILPSDMEEDGGDSTISDLPPDGER